jgi:hypothetical protein
MNIEKKTEAIEDASKEIKSRAEIELEILYMRAYHEGRHTYRDKVKDYLIINPELKSKVIEMSQDPCLQCPEAFNWTEFKKTCFNCKVCSKKQDQLLALDLLKHFEL